MRFLLILIFGFCVTILFGQTNEKKTIRTIVSPSTPYYIYDDRWLCGTVSNAMPYFDRRKKDSLQNILDKENEILAIKNKDYMFSMEVFDDYSYKLVKEYKFQNWYEEKLFGTRVLEQSTNTSPNKESTVK